MIFVVISVKRQAWAQFLNVNKSLCIFMYLFTLGIIIKQKLNLLPIIQSIHIINSNIGNTAQNGCLKL